MMMNNLFPRLIRTNISHIDPDPDRLSTNNDANIIHRKELRPNSEPSARSSSSSFSSSSSSSSFTSPSPTSSSTSSSNILSINRPSLQTAPSSTSLLLLSTSAEAAVIESKRFERGSRQSSLSVSAIGSPPIRPKPNPLLSAKSLSLSSASLSSSSSPAAASANTRSSILTRINSSSKASSALSSSIVINKHHQQLNSVKSFAHRSSLRPIHLHNRRISQHSHNHSQSLTCNQRFHDQLSPSSKSLSSSSSSSSLSDSSTSPLSKPDKLGGLLYECEKCPKVYRHPQCLIKHRWEHTTYWADASKLMLSKHQQVQMLEAAAILAAPSGSLPESRSLWPAAVSPSEAGLLGSEHVNLDVIRSQARPVAPMHHHSTSVPYENSGAGTDAEMGVDEQTDEEVEEEEEEVNEYDPSGGDEDEIMFEMSLGSDENGSTPSPPLQNLFSLGRPDPAPPSMGYFQKRVETPALSCLETASSPLIHANQARVPAMVAYKPAERSLFGLVSVYHPEIIFKPMKPYADSELRFEGKKEEEGDCKTHLKQVEMADNEDVDRGNEEACFDGFENGSDEVVGMEL